MKTNIVAMLGLVVVATLGWLWRSAEERHAAAVREIAALREEVAGKVSPAPSAPLPEKPEDPQAPAAAPVKGKPGGVQMGPYLRLIDELRARTGQLEKELGEAQAEAARQQGRAAEEAERAEKLAAVVAQLREEAAQQRRLAEVYAAELKSKTQRMTSAETAEKVLQERLTQAEQNARRALNLSREVEDLGRRREALIATLERRYREVTDLYRNHALNAQNREGGTPGVQAGDLSRIQSVLNQAEDDLRQLRALNGRLAEIERAARK
jgi:DNA repair exonuclease SbcCD ATPase subunit